MKVDRSGMNVAGAPDPDLQRRLAELEAENAALKTQANELTGRPVHVAAIDAVAGTGDEHAGKWIEVISAVLLSITVILTAWSAFQSSKWGGAMSTSFSQASAARIEAGQATNEAGQDRQVDLSIYNLWLQAKALGTPTEVAYVQARFTDRLKVAFDDWITRGGVSDPQHAPPSPFALESYVTPGTAAAAALSTKADTAYQTALRNNQRGDNYTILSVLFAVVLFFAAMSARFTNRRVQAIQLSFAGVGLIVGIVFLAIMPRLI